jgi:hypothetical protein
LSHLAAAMDLGDWGGEVVRFRRERIRVERKWIARLKERAAQADGKGPR